MRKSIEIPWHNPRGYGNFFTEVISATDYYPYGMVMDDRNYQQVVSEGYRYGFNGKELDKPGMGGGGSTYDYGFRIYNPAMAKFLSVDPLTKEYPWYTPYQFAGNKPIWCSDLDGLEEFIRTDYFNSSGQLYRTEIQVVSNDMIIGQIVHINTVYVDAQGDITSFYNGTLVGTSLPSGGSTAFDSNINQQIWSTQTLINQSNVNGVVGRLERRPSFDFNRGLIGKQDVLVPNNPRVNLQFSGGFMPLKPLAGNPSFGDPNYAGILVTNVNTTATPTNQAYLPAGYHTTPANPQLRFNIEGGESLAQSGVPYHYQEDLKVGGFKTTNGKQFTAYDGSDNQVNNQPTQSDVDASGSVTARRFIGRRTIRITI